MDKRKIEIKSVRNKDVRLNVIPGHFATPNAHINMYVDMFDIKHQYKTARETAKLVAYDFQNTPIDTIVCFEGTRFISGFVTEFLIKNYTSSINYETNMTVLVPEKINYNQFIFRDDCREYICNKNVLVMLAKITTGSVVERLSDCIKYYGGKIAGVYSIFSAVSQYGDIKVNSVFSSNDLPNYSYYEPNECPLCSENRKIDAIVSEHGYTKL
ncbi:hypothetical protein FACS1894132_02740 [Clostridia bacterium]|nr:hypothetical protein FACS1894132_02740 [Clostridia bacterium]